MILNFLALFLNFEIREREPSFTPAVKVYKGKNDEYSLNKLNGA